MNFHSFLIVFIIFFHQVNAQEIKILHQGVNASLRGLSVVNNEVVWASGSNGTVMRTTNGGSSFQVIKPKGYENRDFRDIEAFDSSTAIIIAVDTPAIILKTTDGGQNWRKVFEDKRPGMFLDAMDFNGSTGVAVGDPIDGKMFRAYTFDQGESWTIDQSSPELAEGEAFFASSGSNVKLITSPTAVNKKTMGMEKGIFVSGGMRSRLFLGNQSFNIPLQQGKNSTGANGFAIEPRAKYGFICGGDFSEPKRTDSTMVLFEIKKNMVDFSFPATPPSGYKSAVAFVKAYTLVSCGTSGIDLSTDNGKNWKKISDLPFHVCNAVYGSGKVWMAGPKSTIALLSVVNQ
jgi:photosystem II stability/assembly factor-like uncharacterized protein